VRWLIQTALKLRVAVVALTVVGFIAGLQVVRHAPLDVFPEFAPPLVEVQTEAPGLSTEEVEALVTIPIENALNGTPYLDQLRSKSVLGLSSVVVLFDRGTDLLDARQFVTERLSRVATELPAVARPPVLLSPLSSLSRVMKIGMSSKTLSQIDLTTLAKWTIRPRLIAVPGVANVAIWGQRDRQLQVLVHPDLLRANELTVKQVREAARNAVSVQAGGFIDMPNQRFAVSQRPSVLTAEELARAPVAFRGTAPITLGDVATVVEGHQAPIGDAVIDDVPGLLLIVEKHPWANSLDVTHGVEDALAALAPALPGVKVDPTIFRPATFIEMSISNLNRALLIGVVLVIVILTLFLRNWRTAVISLVAIPLSLVAAAVLMRYRGGTIDTMVLAGLVIALGEVVDDAIIDVENIIRRLRLNRSLEAPRPAFDVVLDASLEVRSAVVYASIIVALVLLPVFFLGGLAGTFFRPLAMAYVVAVMASLVVALIVTPALSLLLLPESLDHKPDPPLVQRLRARYAGWLPWFVDRPLTSQRIVAVALGAAILFTPLLGEEFLPHFREYDFLMHWVEKPGTSLDAMTRVTIRASKDLRGIEGVRNFGSHIGRAEVADEVVGPNFTELWVSVDPSVDYDETVGKIQHVVDTYPGLYRDLLTYLRERIKEVLTGASATIVVRIFGPDLSELRARADAVAATMKNIEGVSDLKVQAQVLVPQIEVRSRQDAAARLGVSPGDVRDQVETLIRGSKVGEVYQDQKRFDVVVWGTPSVRSDPNALRSLPISIANGGIAPLSELADVRIAPAPNEITRQDASRRIDVTANVKGRNLGSVARDVEDSVGTVAFGAGYHPEVLGEFEAQRAARWRLITLSLVSALFIFLILYSDFQSARVATLVFGTIPFALVGSVLAILLTGGVVSLGALVGFVTVLGIAARNGIMLVSHYRHLEREEGVPFGRELVIRGAHERLLPITMTALVTAIALLPLVVSGTKPGHEIEHPMAVVIVGGLVSSTLLNLFLLPPLYLRYAKSS
jgi:CzcA family heavy metal efflux pump